MNPAPEALAGLQRWMQAAVTHPRGAASSAPVEIRSRVLPSAALSAAVRLGIYAGMYRLRLVECLENEFPALRHALGARAFERLADSYIEARPSTHFSLNAFGARFPAFVRAGLRARRHRAFLFELALLERTIQEVFDARFEAPAAPETLLSIPLEAWGGARFGFIEAFRLLATATPVNAWYQAFKDGAPRPRPVRARSFVAVFRQDDFIWRMPLDRERHALLQALCSGATLEAALESCAALPGVDPGTLAPRLGDWFRSFTSSGFFSAIGAPSACRHDSSGPRKMSGD